MEEYGQMETRGRLIQIRKCRGLCEAKIMMDVLGSLVLKAGQ